MEWADPPVLPVWNLPEAPLLPTPILELPSAEIPSYKPLVVPPNTLRPPPGVRGIETKDEAPKDKQTKTKTTHKKATPANPDVKLPDNIPPEAQIVAIPFTDIEVPMPTTTIMTTAATTSVISVGATLASTSLFKYLVMVMKPILKQAWNKLTKKNQNPS
tara:strand:- start:5269 stop:5748 length:480 start_codon:yes stop_codon:yes gene_type:complete